ncbi:hypothetical protein BDF14DRAFT_886011 [Spinellus fusiger]|nr:hypothetical protein BDF14DRAFT_886011 [Spinellus fusiger]
MMTTYSTEFKQRLSVLFEQQSRQEEAINFQALASMVDFNTCLEPLDISESSDFFNDPTLISHVRRYKDSFKHMSLISRSRVSDKSDSITKHKPQAKAVLPHRVLEETDEDNYVKIEKELDKNMYMNPRVPKRRVYLAQNKIPAILSAMNDSSNRMGQSKGSVSMDKMPKGSCSSPVDYGYRDESIEESLEREESTDLQDTEVQDTEVQNTEVQNTEVQDTEEPLEDEISIMEHSDVPDTALTRKLIDMVNTLKQSKLASLSLKSTAEMFTRQHTRANYSIIKKEAERMAQKEKESVEKPKNTKAPRGRKRKINMAQPGLKVPKAEEVVLSIAIYHPKKPSQRLQELEFLGSQKLTQLRDAIYCTRSLGIRSTVFVTNAMTGQLPPANDTPASTCFCIEGSIYLDSKTETT